MSQVTTHVLDTSQGKPARGVKIILSNWEEEWQTMAGGSTDNDGRIMDLLEKNVALRKGIYKLKFETKSYFDVQGIATFYPYVEIIFEIKDGEHYHVPLLLNPFGYSTYRGS
ncbi:MAG: hydroxyisourate hydrolase [Bacteroidota bacterium]|nr:hydroxyisourate hydrolase [Bacteroidota bacterium]